MKYTLFILGCLLSANTLFAQTKKNSDFLKLKAPEIEYAAPDTELLYDSELFDREYVPEKKDDAKTEFEKDSIFFNPKKAPTIVSEDSLDELEGEDEEIVEISEEVIVDSVWIRIAGYYAIWDSRNVNPYEIDGSKFNDTVMIMAYDSSTGKHWHMPLDVSIINSAFGLRRYRWHYGSDLDLNIGDSVYAAFDGIVRIAKFNPGGYGNYVLLRHYNGLETLYGHLTKYNVEVGQLVKAGDVIGLGGNTGRSTGPHLHFETRYQGNAIDPNFFYDFRNHTLKSRYYELTPSVYNYLRQARLTVYHTIKSGDTLSGIARKYRTSVSQICKMNRITPQTILKLGRKIRVR